MFNVILDSISLALHNAYPNNNIHSDIVLQGLKKGDFNISLVAASHSHVMDKRHLQNSLFEVLYYPHKGKDECYDVAYKLTEILDKITVQEQTLKCNGMRFEIVDSVLHIFVKYNLYLIKDILHTAMMGTLDFQNKKMEEL